MFYQCKRALCLNVFDIVVDSEVSCGVDWFSCFHVIGLVWFSCVDDMVLGIASIPCRWRVFYFYFFLCVCVSIFELRIYFGVVKLEGGCNCIGLEDTPSSFFLSFSCTSEARGTTHTPSMKQLENNLNYMKPTSYIYSKKLHYNMPGPILLVHIRRIENN